ncbi:Chromatin-remodeling complex subunit ies6 [Psilocybe cubensis]|uniref:Chromatin-remodeling complex subunit ies6 n=1 Tax=Psilocybe cubensis TaxID=181762 RepID=A0ACB8GJN2_PSICU|nr:Chromatin-remodeling complex subunit ies6 [Psilocybe cubensis]KAH9475809.1 Chromatin-remodeling complex subunit ies6 [Psilocybe cubensis]
MNHYVRAADTGYFGKVYSILHRPPKGGFKKKATGDASNPTSPNPRPFKNPNYTKNVNRRAKNLKAVLGQERERERAEREARRIKREEALKTNPSAAADIPEDAPTYTTIEAPPSVIPHKHLCDITGLEAPYTDPATGLRYHDKSVYEIIKGLSTSIAKDYLSARGVVSIVK